MLCFVEQENVSRDQELPQLLFISSTQGHLTKENVPGWA